MSEISLRFFAELNLFLPQRQQYKSFLFHFDERVSIKHIFESLGVPHTEVDLIIANGESVDFSYIVQPGDWISIYPVFESIDISPIVHVRPAPLRHPKFVLDIHLGKLALYLRMLGFDADYSNDRQDDVLASISMHANRILLTRDTGLLKRKMVTHGYYIHETNPGKQVVEVLRRFDLFEMIQPFQRCLRCNGLLAPVAEDQLQDDLLDDTLRYYHEFLQCQDCKRVYWKGSHYQRMVRFVDEIKKMRT